MWQERSLESKEAGPRNKVDAALYHLRGDYYRDVDKAKAKLWKDAFSRLVVLAVGLLVDTHVNTALVKPRRPGF